MTWGKRGFVIALAAVLAGASGAALAHGRARVGVYFGGPIWWGPSFYYPPPYYYYPPPVVVQSSPPVYIEQGQPQAPAAADASAQAWWYYCRNPEGYYPYVNQCSGQWERVAPQPAK